MHHEFFGFLIPLAWAGFALVAITLRHRRKMAEMALRGQIAPDVPPRDSSAAYIRELEDRVRVLERIVTDRSHALAEEIEALRDPHAARRSPETEPLTTR